jgi:hypothetical protein
MLLRGRTIGLGTTVVLLAVSPPGFANDSTAVMGAGGIELTVSKDVVMESEDLWISADLIRVSYVFRNTGAEDVKTKVAFPVPGIPICDEDCGDWPLAAGPNPMKFKLKVDGQAATFGTIRKKKRTEYGSELFITHHWDQVFPRGRAVTIAHEYRPGAGSAFLGSAGNPTEAYRDLVKEYCLGEKLLGSLTRGKREYVYRTVHYILTTGANWKGPIGRFKLTLVKGQPRDVISTCIADTRRVSDTTFEVVRESFTPTEDLRILFIDRR